MRIMLASSFLNSADMIHLCFLYFCCVYSDFHLPLAIPRHNSNFYMKWVSRVGACLLYSKEWCDITNIQDIEKTPHPSAAHNVYILHPLFQALHTHFTTWKEESHAKKQEKKKRKKKKTFDMINGNPIPARRHESNHSEKAPNFLVKNLFHSSWSWRQLLLRCNCIICPLKLQFSTWKSFSPKKIRYQWTEID